MAMLSSWNIALVSPFDRIGGNLLDLIKSQKAPIKEMEVRRYLQEMCRGIRVLHALNIVHGNIKPENVLLNSDGRVKVGDYLMDERLGAAQESTISYISPEVLQGSPANKALDIWSLGCVLYELCYFKVELYISCLLYTSDAADE
eukprot:TRINITY_DN22494_c0_g2_i2.p1 TRINITY_DN22494_c0_g2~~TRINITY_DN22494_c0_g2_i2.p1  ORF type:complete len:145 (+),score=27.42 TRINITY_DN22494_c0_g2_i2:179-613(+)